MMGFVIKRIDDGKYVAPDGSEHSYVSDIRLARRFATFEVANRVGKCGNERIVAVESELQPLEY